MSEYQYYEFIAIDKPLSEKQQQAARAVSTRAEISPTRFTNVYHYGDFKGSVETFMERYFDAMVYVANWGTRRFMLRLPSQLVERTMLRACCAGYAASMKTKGRFVVIDICSESRRLRLGRG